MNKKEKTNSLLSVTIGTTVMMFAFKLLGFIKQAFIAYYFGTSAALDTYFVAYGFIEGLVDAIVKGIGVATLSVYTHARITGGREKANQIMSGVLCSVIPFGCVVVILICLFASPLSYILAPTYSQEQHAQLVNMVRIMSGLFLFSSINRIQCSILDSEDHFTISRLDSLFQSIFIILSIWALARVLSTYSLVVGDYIAFVSYAILLALNISGFAKFSFVNSWRIPEVRKVVILAIPLMLGNGMTQINEMVDKILATNLGDGNVSSLAYCHTLAQFITNIVIVNVGNILLAKFANYVAAGKKDEIISILNKALMILLYLLIPICVITIFCAQDIVTIVYFRGNFNSNAVGSTSIALIGYALSFSIIAVRDILTKSMYAYQNTREPMINGSLSIVLNIILSIFLSHFLGIIGIPLGTSISALITMFFNMKSFKHNLPEFSYSGIKHVFVYSVPAVIVESIVLWGLKNIALSTLLSFMISAVFGFMSYYLTIVVFGDKDAKRLIFDGWELLLSKVRK